MSLDNMLPKSAAAVGLQGALRSINAQYGEGSVQVGGKAISDRMAHRYAFSNILALTMAIGTIPLGRIIEIHGSEDSGKTALALHLAQRIGEPILFMDADCGLSPIYLQGINEMYCMYPETLEDALEVCRSAAGAFGTIVIDTLSALPTRADLACRLDDCRLSDGGTAKILSHALPILMRTLQRTGCTLILVNQMRNDPRILVGRMAHPTGGRAIGYYAAQRLATYRTERNKYGQRVMIVAEKNKYAAPFRRAEVSLIYGRGLAPREEWEAVSSGSSIVYV